MLKKAFYFTVIFIVVSGVAGCKNPVADDTMGGPPPGANSALYNVTASFTTQTYNYNSGNQIFQLEIEPVDGLFDPDGDVVYFRSDIPSGSWLLLNESTGLVTVDTTDPHSPASFSFWSEDVNGADSSGTPFDVIVAVSSNPPYPATAGFSTQSLHQGAAGSTFQMSIDEVDGLKDPDGDTVYFRSNAAAWVTLDQNTGLVTVDTTEEHAALTISFWTEDEFGADTSCTSFDVLVDVFNNTPYSVTGPSIINFQSGTPSSQSVTLTTDAPGGTSAGFLDPDGDATTFVSSLLPSYAVLDDVNGIIAVVDVPDGTPDLTITVWIVDANLKQSFEFDIVLHFVP